MNTACEICSGQGCREILKTRDFSGTVAGTFRILKCDRCRTAFLSPLPEQNKIGLFYPASYYPFQEADFQALLKKVRKLTGTWRRRVLQAKYGYPFGFPQNRNSIWRFPFFRYERKGVLPYRNKGRVLDVGCGNGEFLFLSSRLGWETYGVEINPQAADCARRLGINVFCGELAQAGFPERFFDVVRFNHVLEHLRDPREVLNIARRIIKEDGYLIISVPNIEGIGFRVQRIIHHRGKGILVRSLIRFANKNWKEHNQVIRKNPLAQIVLDLLGRTGRALHKGEGFTAILVPDNGF